MSSLLKSLLPQQVYQAAKAEKLKRKAALKLPDPAVRHKPKLWLKDWVQAYRPLLKPDLPFDWTTHQYLVGIYEDDCEAAVYMKAGQMGISEYLLSWSMWNCAERHATGLYIMPTDTHVSDFSAARLGPAIEQAVAPRLAALIVPATGGARGADRVGLKRIGSSFLYFRGAKVKEAEPGQGGQAPQLKSIDADFEVRDEVDEMSPAVKSIALERLGHSALAVWRAASTPTSAEHGIHAEYLESDRRVWMVRCQACGERQELSLKNLVLEWDALDRPTKWHALPGSQTDDDLVGKPFLACQKCGERLDRAGPGEWVPELSSRTVHGYLIPGLASARKPLAAIIEGLQGTDESKREQTYNQKLGLTYKSSLAQSLSDSVLDACRREYKVGPVAGEDTWMGIDVGRVLNVIIRARVGGERPLRYAGQVADFADAVALLKAYRVKTTVIDALPETRKSREFQKMFPRLKVWVAYYVAQKQGSKDQAPGDWDARELAVNLDRTRAIDITFALFQAAALRDEAGEAPAEGNTLPVNARFIADYYAQMKAPERKVVKDATGNPVAHYIETGPDHYAHAETYCAMAMLCPYTAWSRGAG